MKKKIKTLPASKPASKNLGGRPVKYTPEFIEALAPEMVQWFKKKKNFYLKMFCCEKGFPSNRLSEFAEKSEVFADALRMCKDLQECKLVNKGFQAYKDRFAIFILKNVAGMRDRTDITTGDEPITAVTVTIHKAKR